MLHYVVGEIARKRFMYITHAINEDDAIEIVEEAYGKFDSIYTQEVESPAVFIRHWSTDEEV